MVHQRQPYLNGNNSLLCSASAEVEVSRRRETAALAQHQADLEVCDGVMVHVGVCCVLVCVCDGVCVCVCV